MVYTGSDSQRFLRDRVLGQSFKSAIIQRMEKTHVARWYCCPHHD